MKSLFAIVVLCFCLLLAYNSIGKKSGFITDSLWEVITSPKKLDEKIQSISLLDYYYFQQGKISKSDSALALGISLANQGNAPELEMDLYAEFFSNIERINQDSGLKYLTRFKQLAKASNSANRVLEATIAEASFLSCSRNFDSAIKVLASANYLLSKTDEKLNATFNLKIGQAYKNTNKKILAFEYLTKAIALSQKQKNNDLLCLSFLQLADFYRQINNFEMALFYNKKTIELITAAPEIDSIKLILAESDITGTYLGQGDKEKGEQYFEHVIGFAVRNNYYNIKSGVFRIYRSFLVSHRYFKDLYKLYRVDFPEEYESVRATDECEFNRLSAFIQEGNEKVDSARYFYQKASDCLLANPRQKIFNANFLKRYGEFLLREGDRDNAKKQFELSLELAQTAGYLPFMVDATAYLDTISANQGDYESAYKYSRLNKIYADSLALINRNSQLLQLEIKNEEGQLTFASNEEKQRIMAKYRLQLLGFGIGLASAVIILIITFRNFRVQQKLNNLLGKEKKRSEDLLLNILPVEVAEELKNKGHADAHSFEPVTVMFTDFKGFTNISERLTPQELVNELHTCFSEFDAITKRHNIEKIKTVGDAYLAAAGLPIPDANHAYNMVLAAMEIVRFMVQRRERLGDKTFEIRVGIHSGSVVAGIVGVSKFAYDIWGDSVNIAARMEQHSDAGRINLSEATWTLVKSKVKCTPRGKVSVKNKGELAMYFVEKLIDHQPSTPAMPMGAAL